MKSDLPNSQHHKLTRMSYQDILNGLSSKSKRKKGLALEALAVHLARILRLEVVQWQLRKNKTGDGEMNMVMEGARLIFRRWHVSCKVSDYITFDDLAVDAGLSVSSKPNVILILASGRATREAQDFARATTRATDMSMVIFDQRDMAALIGARGSPQLIKDKLDEELQEVIRVKNRAPVLWN